MLPTFVIGLREGLEASLIVGIVAAFLRRSGTRGALRSMWIGVAVAVVLCFAVGITLDVVARDLPQRQQEGLETVVGLIAVAMVTYMIVWMKNNSRGLKGTLESAAGTALAQGSTLALSVMAFLAVLREGFETAVFLLAAFNASGSAGPAALGAVLGIAVAIGLGYAIYRGGVRINLSRFFRGTGVVLALVAAGLVVSALHTAHEAGWLHAGQQRVVSLTWLAEPGSIRASLLTGVLGIQSEPTLIEVVGWLVYLVPVLAVVVWPPTVRVPWRSFSRALVGGAALAGIAAVAVSVAAPAQPAGLAGHAQAVAIRDTTELGPAATVVGLSGRPTASSVEPITIRSATRHRVDIAWGNDALSLRAQGSDAVGGGSGRVYSNSVSGVPAAVPATGSANGRAASTLTLKQITDATGGRLPLGISSQTTRGAMPVSYTKSTKYQLVIDPASLRILDAGRTDRTVASVTVSSGGAASLGVVDSVSTAATGAFVEQAVASARDHARTAERRDSMRVKLPVLLVVVGLLAVSAAWLLRWRIRPQPVGVAPPTAPSPPGPVEQGDAPDKVLPRRNAPQGEKV